HKRDRFRGAAVWAPDEPVELLCWDRGGDGEAVLRVAGHHAWAHYGLRLHRKETCIQRQALAGAEPEQERTTVFGQHVAVSRGILPRMEKGGRISSRGLDMNPILSCGVPADVE